MVQKITPNLWCDGNAREVAEFYTSVFPNGSITGGSLYPQSKEDGLADFQLDLAGKDLVVSFTIADLEFTAINAGPEFKPTPALSFLVNFDPSRDEHAHEHIDAIWHRLIEGGEALIEIGEHPFSKRYGWVQDKYGFSWQLILTNPDGEPRPIIIPDLMFGANVQNRAEEAMNYYASVFENSIVNIIARYNEERSPVVKDSVMFGEFKLEDQWFAAMDSAVTQSFAFNEAVSLSIACRDQDEIDYLWSKLSSDPDFEQCGWCKDRFGVSWQIVPSGMDSLMQKPGAYEKMMHMKKIVINDF